MLFFILEDISCSRIPGLVELCTEGTSALFLMTSGAVQDKVAEAMKGLKFELIASNLSKEEEDKLRAVFAEEETAPAQ